VESRVGTKRKMAYPTAPHHQPTSTCLADDRDGNLNAMLEVRRSGLFARRRCLTTSVLCETGVSIAGPSLCLSFQCFTKSAVESPAHWSTQVRQARRDWERWSRRKMWE